MRLVTFQSRDILNRVLNTGVAETLIDLRNCPPRNLRAVPTDKIYVLTDNGMVARKDEDDSIEGVELSRKIISSKRKDRIYPFYAYSKHSYCGDMHQLSVYVIYRMASHFFAYMGYESRDIIELEVPEGALLEIRKTDSYEECLLPCIKREWLVSALTYKDTFEDCTHHENAFLYENNVYDESTYRMCYSKDIVFTGHGYGDNVDLCLSPNLLKDITTTMIQYDYVQPDVKKAFICYCYMLRHNLTMNDLNSIKLRDAANDMPNEFNSSIIKTFNECKDKIFEKMGITTPTVAEYYFERKNEYQKDNKEGIKYHFERKNKQKKDNNTAGVFISAIDKM